MKTIIDNDKYDACARSFLAALAKYVRNDLSELPLSGKRKTELTQSLVFNIAALLDGTGNLEHEERIMVPHLAFQLEGESTAVIDDGSIALHELCDFGEE